MASDEDNRYFFHEELPPAELPKHEIIILSFLAILIVALICWGFYWLAMLVFGWVFG